MICCNKCIFIQKEAPLLFRNEQNSHLPTKNQMTFYSIIAGFPLNLSELLRLHCDSASGFTPDDQLTAFQYMV